MIRQLSYTVAVFLNALMLLVSLSACGHDEKFYRVSEYSPPSVAENGNDSQDDATDEYPNEPIDDADETDGETDVADGGDTGTPNPIVAPNPPDGIPAPIETPNPPSDEPKGCQKNPKARKHCKL